MSVKLKEKQIFLQTESCRCKTMALATAASEPPPLLPSDLLSPLGMAWHFSLGLICAVRKAQVRNDRMPNVDASHPKNGPRFASEYIWAWMKGMLKVLSLLLVIQTELLFSLHGGRTREGKANLDLCLRCCSRLKFITDRPTWCMSF